MEALTEACKEHTMVLIELLYPYLLPVALVLFSISLWQYYINSLRDRRSNLPLPPGTVGLPFVGETFSMLFQGWSFYKSRKEKYGHVYKTHILGKPTIRVWGTENIRKVLKNEETLVTMSWPTSVLELIGRGGLVSSTRRVHNVRRAAISKAFSTKTMSEFAPLIRKLIKIRVQNWCSNPDSFSGLTECRRMALEISAQILLGVHFSEQQVNKLVEIMSTIVSNFFTLPIDVPGTGFHKGMKARGELIEIIRDIINQRLSAASEGDDVTSSHPSILSLLLPQIQDGSLNQYELEDTTVEMFFSSYQGLPSLACSSIVHLGKNPEVVSRLLKELDTCKSNGDDQTLSELSFLEKCWKEVARVCPPFGGGFRQVIKTFELEGYQIPAGWTVLYSIRDNHEAEENYYSAETFNPDRWDEVKSDESFIPFGGNGIRSCVGKNYTIQFIRQFITTLVQEANWQLVERDCEFVSFPIYLPKSGLPVTFTAKKANSL